MTPYRLISFIVICSVFAAGVCAYGAGEKYEVSGELKKWHTVTLTFTGPETSETAEPNPFRDYRLSVTFVKGKKQYVVPGYYAADGNAAQSGATSGNKWRVHFVPDEVGRWSFGASFRTGPDIALSTDRRAGSAAAFDGATGTLEITETDKTGRDHRAKGMLKYIGKRYLQFAETGDYFIKGGADSPENFLAYADFDDTYDAGDLRRQGEAAGDKFIHQYAPHVQDWRAGDPSWKDGKGKGMIGALNYLASKGMNSVYFLTYNIDGGDGKDVWPWTSPEEKYRFDCSKLDQWEIIFSHMDSLGLMLHVVTQETENDQGLDGGELGPQRKLYYRELIARFAHHLALTWNLGEENTNTTEQRKAFCKYIKNLDPYSHPVVCHTFPGKYDEVYEPLLGYEYFDGPSLQTNDTHAQTTKWLDSSASAGRQWFVSLDEIGPADTGVKPDKDDYWHDEVRNRHLWGHLMAGGAGVEWYFGYKWANNDLNCEDWRSRDHMWDLTRYALEFFHWHLPFTEMAHHDELTSAKDDPSAVSSGPNRYCFAKPGEIYAIYLPAGGTTNLDLGDSSATFTIQWYNPRRGEGILPLSPTAGKPVLSVVEGMPAGPKAGTASPPLQTGTKTETTGPGQVSIGQPPSDLDKPAQPTAGRDWVALVKRK